MKSKMNFLIFLFLIPRIAGCAAEEDDSILNPEKGNHSIRLVNQFDVNGMDASGKLNLELDGRTVIADVPVGSSKTYSGISSGRHYYQILYEGPAYATWEQGYHDFIGTNTTLVVIVNSDGRISGYIST